LQNNTRIKFILLSLLVLCALLLSVFYGGSERVSPWSGDDFIFFEIRVPKTLTALIAGCTLSVAGLILQVIFRNPLAGPYVLGISSGAALMVAVSIMAGSALGVFSNLLLGRSFMVVSAITGSFLVTLLILAISKRVSSNVVLLLIGLMFSQICGAIQSALEYFADPGNLKNFVVWGMGSLGNTTRSDLLIFAPIAFFSLLLIFFLIKPLNALLLGQSYAQNSGVDFKQSRFWLILIASVLTGITTAFCGPIAFIGTAVPILSRMIFKTSRQQAHLFSCMLIGSAILLISDALSNSLIKNVALPINMITTFIGAPLIIYLMFKNKQW
jgi:iron complex transport system permease protein